MKPVFPFEIIGAISQLIDDSTTLKNLLLCNGQYLDFCRSEYLGRVRGFAEDGDLVYATDREAIRALFVWDLKPRTSYTVNLHIACFSDEIPVLTSFLNTRMRGKRCFHAIQIAVRPKTAVDIVPLLDSAAKIGVVDLNVRYVPNFPQQSEMTLLQTTAHSFHKTLAQSSITALHFTDVDLSPPDIQNLLRFNLASLRIDSLGLTRCGKHCILAGLRMPTLQSFTTSIDYGRGGIVAFVSCQPALRFLSIHGTREEESRTSMLLPLHHHLPDLRCLIGSLSIAEQLLSGVDSYAHLRYLSVRSDHVITEAFGNTPNSYAAKFGQRVYRLAQEATQLYSLELDVLSKGCSDVWMEPTCPLLRELCLWFTRCSSSITPEEIVVSGRFIKAIKD